MNRLAKSAQAVRNNKGALVAMMFVLAGSAMAQTGDSIDTSSVVATITSGLAAIAAIGAAFLGFKYLKKVWNRL